MKAFKNSIIVGRFQPLHIGHEKLINIGLSVSEKVLVFVGSSDKKGTDRNPFDAETRIRIISKVFKKEIEEGRVIVRPLNDLTNENDLSYAWGDYVVSEAEKALGERLECIIYGKDKNIFKCFSKKIVDGISEIFIDRKQLVISATKVREYILQDNKECFEKYTSSSVHDEYDTLKDILINCKEE